MYSVRRRLLLVLAAGFAILIAGAAAFVEARIADHVTAEFDDALLTKAQTFVALTEQEGGRIELDYEPALMPEFEREEEPEYFQYWLEDGTPQYRSGRLGTDLPRASSLAAKPAIRDVELPDGRPGRMVALAFTPKRAESDDPNEAAEPGPAAPAVFFTLARGRGGLDRLIGRMRVTLFGAGAVAVLLALVLVWRALVAGLRPVEVIAAQVQKLDAERLDARVGLDRMPRELAPIVAQLNALLDRLHASFARERRFTGNVAHELRTPIAELRSLAEVGAKWPDDTESVVRFFDDVHDVARRMESVISNLLLLARCQAGVERVERAPVPLRPLLEAAWKRLAGRAAENGLSFELDVPTDVVVESDAGKLEIMFANVLGNAVSYARPASTIRASAAGDGGRLDIENAAEPLAEGEIERLTEPFWRKDEARSSPDHAGLGLSVVRALAEVLGLDVGFTQDRDGTFRVRFSGFLSVS
jgi:two-component system sensor histidine kinase QseC